MNEPKRIQLRRTKGWRLPPNTIVVARPSKWGNPYPFGVESPFSREDAVRMYRDVVMHGETWWDDGFSLHRFTQAPTGDLGDLTGKNLACWCPLDQPCHADVLLALANSEVTP